MADQVQVSGTFALTRTTAPVVGTISITQAAISFTQAGKHFVRKTQTIGFSAAEALDLGDVATPGWAFIKNVGLTNYIKLLTAVAGEEFARLGPGEFVMGKLAPGVTEIAAQAAVANEELEYLIAEA